MWVCGTNISYEILTICCHANSDALFETTFLALVPCYFVYHAFSFIFTGIAWVKIFLNSSPEKALTMEKYIVTIYGLEKKYLNSYCQYSTVRNANCTKTLGIFNLEVRWLHDPWVSTWDIEDFWPKFSIHWASAYTKPHDIVIQHFIHVIFLAQLQLSSLFKTSEIIVLDTRCCKALPPWPAMSQLVQNPTYYNSYKRYIGKGDVLT